MTTYVPIPLVTFDAVIANGASLSGVVDLNGHTLVGILMPGTWTTAVLTFQAGEPVAASYTLANVYDQFGTEKTVQAAASRFIALDPSEWAAVRWLKVRSGTAGSAVNQGGARTVVLVARPLG